MLLSGRRFRCKGRYCSARPMSSHQLISDRAPSWVIEDGAGCYSVVSGFSSTPNLQVAMKAITHLCTVERN